jgi:hypothetical protein
MLNGQTRRLATCGAAYENMGFVGQGLFDVGDGEHAGIWYHGSHELRGEKV